MADEPSKTPGTPAERPSPQIIPLSKIHDLPGVFIPKQPDKSYGGLVSSIQASGVKEPVILRLREDGEYQLASLPPTFIRRKAEPSTPGRSGGWGWWSHNFRSVVA